MNFKGWVCLSVIALAVSALCIPGFASAKDSDSRQNRLAALVARINAQMASRGLSLPPASAEIARHAFARGEDMRDLASMLVEIAAKKKADVAAMLEQVSFAVGEAALQKSPQLHQDSARVMRAVVESILSGALQKSAKTGAAHQDPALWRPFAAAVGKGAMEAMVQGGQESPKAFESTAAAVVSVLLRTSAQQVADRRAPGSLSEDRALRIASLALMDAAMRASVRKRTVARDQVVTIALKEAARILADSAVTAALSDGKRVRDAVAVISRALADAALENSIVLLAAGTTALLDRPNSASEILNDTSLGVTQGATLAVIRTGAVSRDEAASVVAPLVATSASETAESQHLEQSPAETNALQQAAETEAASTSAQETGQIAPYEDFWTTTAATTTTTTTTTTVYGQ